MLFRLLLFRLGPFIGLHFCKERKQMKLAVRLLLLCYGVCLIIAVWKIVSEKKWLGILYVPISMFPHYIFYGFAIWILVRCIWSAWSERVWRRIYQISLLCIILGILTENYWNPKILHFFFEIFK